MMRWILVGPALLLHAAPLCAQEDWVDDFSTVGGRGRAPLAEAQTLAREIGILNLVNGLNLTAEQMRAILQLAREVRDLRSGIVTRHAEAIRAFRDALAELRAKVLTTEARIPPCCEEKVQAAEKEIRQIRYEYHQRLRELDRKLREVLTAAQKRVIRDFNPCLIPPKDLKDPVRVGQAGGPHAEIAMHLEHLRNLPSKAYASIIDPILERLLDEWQPVLHFTEKERAAEKARLQAVVNRARALSAEEFELEKEELAGEVVRRFTEFQEKAAKATEFFSRLSPVSKAGKWLLNPRIVPLLEHKLEHLGDLPEGTARKERADSCKNPEDCGRHGASDPASLRCRCGKPTFEWLRRELGIPREAAGKAREALGKGQVEMLNLLAEKRADGTIPLLQMFTEPGRMLQILAKEAPGGGTYLERIEEIKRRMLKALRAEADPDKFDAFVHSGVDLFDIHAGDLRRFEEEEW